MSQGTFRVEPGVFAIFVVALLTGLVGFYTENDGFMVSAGIFLLVGLVLVIRKFLTK